MKKTKKIIAKFAILILVLLTTFLSVPREVFAQEGNWYNQSPLEWYVKVYDENASPPNEIFGERYTAAQVQWILYSLISLPLNAITNNNTSLITCLLAARDRTVLVDTCGSGIAGIFDQIKGFFDLPEIRRGSTPSPLALVFNTDNRPISGIAYTKQVLSRLSLIPEVKAQQSSGFGFGALGVVQPLWKGVRDFSYAIFVIVIVVLSFMIMFRIKISPQAVISVQAALPKIVIALILTTFSYAIAGFMVDLMYVFMGAFAALFTSAGLSDNFSNVYNTISGQGPVSEITGSFAIFFYLIVYDLMLVFSVIWAFVGAVLSLSLFASLVSIIFVLVVFWVVLVAIWYTIKVPYVLIKALVQIFFLVIVAPIQIVVGVLVPQMGFTSWLKSLVANLLVFPITGIFLYLAFYFLFYSFRVGLEVIVEQNIISEVGALFGVKVFSGPLPGNLWSPPLLGSGAEMSALIFIFMSFSLIIIIPKATDIVKAIIMGERFTYGSAIGESIGPFKGLGGLAATVGGRPAASVLVDKMIGKYNIENRGLGGLLHLIRAGLTQQNTQAGRTGGVKAPGERR